MFSHIADILKLGCVFAQLEEIADGESWSPFFEHYNDDTSIPQVAAFLRSTEGCCNTESPLQTM